MIKNIIFDLGNVVLSIDTKLSEKEFAAYGLTDFKNLYTLASQAEIFDRLEIGKISPEEFYEEFRQIIGADMSDEIIEKCWNALILDYRPEVIELLKKLKIKYRTFLLSNTNKIHYDYYTEILKHNFRVNGLQALMEKAYFSHEIGMKKPDEKVFNFVLSDADILPGETLFIDDNKDNIMTAQKLGIQTIWLTNNNIEHLDIWRELL
jgi:putative hydrolase of the HAD superfamily